MPTPETYASERDQITVAIKCPKCGQRGETVWEENHFVSPKGPQSCLLSLSDGFYERISNRSPYQIELVCHRCEAVRP
jgi:hypothetical protein